jgi:hypothetical protein
LNVGTLKEDAGGQATDATEAIDGNAKGRHVDGIELLNYVKQEGEKRAFRFGRKGKSNL